MANSLTAHINFSVKTIYVCQSCETTVKRLQTTKDTNAMFLFCAVHYALRLKQIRTRYTLSCTLNATCVIGLLIEADPSFYTQLLGKNRRAWSINACLSPYNTTSFVSDVLRD